MNSRFSNRRVCLRLLAAGVAFALGGCAGLEPAAPENVAEASPAWLDAQKPRIAARAQARWAALIKGDFATAYQFETPAYRSVFSAQQFQSQFGGAAMWTMAKVNSVRYDQNNVALVSVDVHYTVALPASVGHTASRVMQERWLYTDGDWWYISR